MSDVRLKRVNFEVDDLAKIRELLPHEGAYRPIKGTLAFPDVDDPSEAYLSFIIDNDDDLRNGWISVDIKVGEGITGFSVTDKTIYPDIGIHDSYAAKLNDAFLEGVVKQFTGHLKQITAPKPKIVSTEPVQLYSIPNPTQKFDMPRVITGWSVFEKVKIDNGREYFRVRKPNTIKPWDGGWGYSPVNVVLVGDVSKNGAIANAYRRAQGEIERHLGADFRAWQLKEDGTLIPLGGSNPQAIVYRINLKSENWWREALTHVHTDEGSNAIDDTPVIFVRDSANIPPSLSSHAWPAGNVLFVRHEVYGDQAYGQQTIDAVDMEKALSDPNLKADTPGDRELRRIAQGLSQRYFESMQCLETATDFLVEASSVKVTPSE